MACNVQRPDFASLVLLFAPCKKDTFIKSPNSLFAQEVPSTEVKRVEVHFAWKLDMYIADISYTLSDEIGSWKEIAVFGMKKAACQKVYLFFFLKL